MLRPFLRGSCGRPTTFLFLFGVGSDWLVGGAGVGDFPGFSQKLILISSFSSDIEWGWGPKISRPPGEVNTKNYQNDFFKGVNMENIIQIPYTPRPAWAKVLHKELSRHRFAVIVAHRRFGKTIGMVNHLIRDALQSDLISPQYALVGPFSAQMEIIAWGPLKYYTSVIEGIKVNETKKYVEFPSKIPGAQGARIYIVGANNPDALRGTYWDGVILDEYSDMKPEMWTQIIRPAIENGDRKGYCYFIGTPKGQNNFYEMYKKAKTNKRYFAYLSNVYDSGILDAKSIEELKEDMPEVEFRQEYLCDFSVSAINELFSLEELDKAFSRELTEKDVPYDMPLVQGADIARFGDDRTCIWRRKGLMAYAKPRIYKKLNTMQTADYIALAMDENKADMTFIDVGNMGAGVVDRLRQMGYTALREIPFQGAAIENKRYENIRAEMYFKLKDWIEDGGALPDEPGLREELAVIHYKYSKNGRLILTPKEEIKEKLGRSPDLADGLALTFARKVPLRQLGFDDRKPKVLMCNTEYSIMGAI